MRPSIGPDPREFIRVVPLAHGFRIDIRAAFPGGPAKDLAPTHYPTRELAERFAGEMRRITGLPIIAADEVRAP